MRRRTKRLEYGPEVLDLHQRLLAEIEDLNALVAKQRKLIQEMATLLDYYSQADIPNEGAKRNPSIVKKARKNLAEETKCAYCGRQGTETDPDGKKWHMDHIVPLALGGNDSLDNIVKACRYCNLKKGVRELFPWDGALKADGSRYYRQQGRKAV